MAPVEQMTAIPDDGSAGGTRNGQSSSSDKAPHDNASAGSSSPAPSAGDNHSQPASPPTNPANSPNNPSSKGSSPLDSPTPSRTTLSSPPSFQSSQNAPNEHGGANSAQDQSISPSPSQKSASRPFSNPKGTGLTQPGPSRTASTGRNDPATSNQAFGSPIQTGDSALPTRTNTPLDGSNPSEQTPEPKFGPHSTETSSPSNGVPSLSTPQPTGSQNGPGSSPNNPFDSSPPKTVLGSSMPFKGTQTPAHSSSVGIPSPSSTPTVTFPGHPSKQSHSQFHGSTPSLPTFTPFGGPIASSQDSGPGTTSVAGAPIHQPNDPPNQEPSLSLPAVPTKLPTTESPKPSTSPSRVPPEHSPDPTQRPSPGPPAEPSQSKGNGSPIASSLGPSRVDSDPVSTPLHTQTHAPSDKPSQPSPTDPSHPPQKSPSSDPNSGQSQPVNGPERPATATSSGPSRVDSDPVSTPSHTQTHAPSDKPLQPSPTDPTQKPPSDPSSGQDQSANGPEQPSPSHGNQDPPASAHPTPSSPKQVPTPSQSKTAQSGDSPQNSNSNTGNNGKDQNGNTNSGNNGGDPRPSIVSSHSTSLVFTPPPPISTAPNSRPGLLAASNPPNLESSFSTEGRGALQTGSSENSISTLELTTILMTTDGPPTVVSTFVPSTFTTSESTGLSVVITHVPTQLTITPTSVFTMISTLSAGGVSAISKSNHTGPIVGAFVGAVVVALILAVTTFFLIRRRNRKPGPVRLQEDMAFAGDEGGVSIPPPEPPVGGFFASSQTSYSPVSMHEQADEDRETSESAPSAANGEYRSVLVPSPSMESLRESLSSIARLSPVPQLLLGNPFGDHLRMDESDDDRSTISGGFGDTSSVGHSSAPSLRSSASVRSTRSTASTVRVKRMFRNVTASSESDPFTDANNSSLIDHDSTLVAAPSSAEFVSNNNNPFDDLFQPSNTIVDHHLIAESSGTAEKEVSRLSAGSYISDVSYEPSETGTIGRAL